jgi:sepiapterin reductase
MEVVFVTGASRGYGRALSVEYARAASSPTTLVLFSRGVPGLEATRGLVLAAAPAHVAVHLVPCDLSDLDSLAGVWASALAALPAQWSRAVLLNNAGGSGRVGQLRGTPLDTGGIAAMRAALDLDLLSPWVLSTLFLQAVAARCAPLAAAAAGPAAPSVLVNISSLAALQPFACLGAYSVTRAARDMLARVVGEEEAPGVLTLSYAPGPMDSELQQEILGSPGCHASYKEFFADMAQKKTWVDMGTSAALCVRLINRPGAFASGAHVDFYDAQKAEQGGAEAQ